jgi:hypothetical protein
MKLEGRSRKPLRLVPRGTVDTRVTAKYVSRMPALVRSTIEEQIHISQSE